MLSAERWRANTCVAVEVHGAARDTGGVAGQRDGAVDHSLGGRAVSRSFGAVWRILRHHVLHLPHAHVALGSRVRLLRRGPRWQMARTPHMTVSHLTVVVEDAAEIEETCGTEVGGDLLWLACTGDVLHLGTVDHAQIARDLKGSWRLGLTLVLALWGQICWLGRLVLGMLWGFLLSAEGYEDRRLLLVLRLLLLLREGVVRPWWLHTVGNAGRWGGEVGYSVVGVCNVVRVNRRRHQRKVGAWLRVGESRGSL